jgi:hypothetical protein
LSPYELVKPRDATPEEVAAFRAEAAESEPAALTWPRKCSCCGAEYSREEWKRLPHPRNGSLQQDIVDRRFDLEMRDCVCRNTMSVLLSAVQP